MTQESLASDVRIREADRADVATIAALLGELGYPSSSDDVKKRLGTLAVSSQDRVLVAMRGDEIVGVASVHVFPVLHSNNPAAQLMLLVVEEGSRRRGVGKKLVGAAEDWARDRGCRRLLVSSGLEREDANAFYSRLGFVHYARRFSKDLFYMKREDV